MQQENWKDLCREMVDTQLRPKGIQSEKVLNAILRVPRHQFVPESLQERAYEDTPLSIGAGQTISQPYMVAQMTQLLDIQPDDRVLEIGTGSGYQTAILSRLAGEVISIERIQVLAETAEKRLSEAGYSNIRIICGDGSLGYAEKAPFNKIIVTAGAPVVPETLCDQLTDNGLMVCPAGDRELQQLYLIKKDKEKNNRSAVMKCRFVPLIGDNGWNE